MTDAQIEALRRGAEAPVAAGPADIDAAADDLNAAFRTDPARQEYSIEKSKNSADDPGRGQDQCAKKKRVLSCDFQHGIDSFHGIAQIV